MGLEPGHTYRIIASLTTLDMNSIESNWSASLCATYNRGTDKLSAKQAVKDFGVPLVPGIDRAISDPAEAKKLLMKLDIQF